jgi:hypothetical protein
MNSRSYHASPDRTPVTLGCVGAVVMSLLSCCALAGLALAPALSESIPAPPAPDPARADITIIVAEPYLNRALTDALPGAVPGTATLDVRPGNRMVATAMFDLELIQVQVVTVARLAVEGGQLQVTVESFEAEGYDITSLLGVDSSGLSRAVGEAIQGQIEAGLGAGAELLGIVTDEGHLTITARWAQ